MLLNNRCNRHFHFCHIPAVQRERPFQYSEVIVLWEIFWKRAEASFRKALKCIVNHMFWILKACVGFG